MSTSPITRRTVFARIAAATALSLGALAPMSVHAATPIKFQLDWRFEGPAGLFLHPIAKGHFTQAGLDVTLDAGSGSVQVSLTVAHGDLSLGTTSGLTFTDSNGSDGTLTGYAGGVDRKRTLLELERALR